MPTEIKSTVTDDEVETLAHKWHDECHAQRLKEGLDPFSFSAKKHLEDAARRFHAASKFILMPSEMQDKVIFTLWSFACNSNRKEAQRFILSTKDSLEMARVMILQALENLPLAIKQAEYLEATKQ